jgi:hypothetical protein
MEMERDTPPNGTTLIKSTQKYFCQLWEGKNTFCCKGKCMAGPKSDMAGQICVAVFMLAAGGLYYALIATPMAEKISVLVPIAWTFVYIGLWVSWFGVICSDPGIIPRRKHFMITPDAIRRKGLDS